MIHIATVHYETDKWVDLQLRYIKLNIKQEYRIYAFLSGAAIKHRNKFYFSCCEPIKPHATKLNILADIICLTAAPNDVIMFIDGDAFPIAPLDDFINSSLEEFPLTAIQRIENLNSQQPHPSFCITKANFWRKINGDWNKDFKNNVDVGGILYNKLKENNIYWGKIHRSNSLGTHKLFYGVYGNIIYHHVAGFRKPLTSFDRCTQIKSLQKLVKLNKKKQLTIFDYIVKIPLIIHYQLIKNRITKMIIKNNDIEGSKIYNEIATGSVVFLKEE